MLPFIFMTSSAFTNPLESTFKVPRSNRRWYWVQVESAGYLFSVPKERARMSSIIEASASKLFSQPSMVLARQFFSLWLYSLTDFKMFGLPGTVTSIDVDSNQRGYLTTCLEQGVRRSSPNQSTCSPSHQLRNLIDIPKHCLLMSLVN